MSKTDNTNNTKKKRSVIEFCGVLSDRYKKYYLKKNLKILRVSISIGLAIVIVPIAILCIVLAPLYITLIVITGLTTIFLVALITISKSKSLADEMAKILPVKVIIENGEIAALNHEQMSQLGCDLNGIESLNVDGYYITDIKPISEVVKVVDFGEWYCVFFSSRHLVTHYVCQKNLIVKGTIEDFEKLFKGKIVRKYKNSIKS